MPDDSAYLSTNPPAEIDATVDTARGESWNWPQAATDAGSIDRQAWASQRAVREKEYPPNSPTLSLKRRVGETSAGWIKLAMNLSGMAALGKRNAKAIALSTHSIQQTSLAADLDGLRILYISDPHFDSMPDFADALIDRVRGLRCDLLIAGGDYRFGNGGEFAEHDTMDALARLRDVIHVGLGSFAILGNHDCAAMAPHIEQAGFRLLINETDVIPVGNATVAITGLDDVYTYATGAADDALARGALVPADYSISLVHSPELADEAAAAGHHLYLCGHTHGGPGLPSRRQTGDHAASPQP